MGDSMSKSVLVNSIMDKNDLEGFLGGNWELLAWRSTTVCDEPVIVTAPIPHRPGYNYFTWPHWISYQTSAWKMKELSRRISAKLKKQQKEEIEAEVKWLSLGNLLVFHEETRLLPQRFTEGSANLKMKS